MGQYTANSGDYTVDNILLSRFDYYKVDLLNTKYIYLLLSRFTYY